MIYLEAIYRIGSNSLMYWGKNLPLSLYYLEFHKDLYLDHYCFFCILMIVNCFTDNDMKLVLYADDTKKFITGDSRHNLIEKANNVLIKVNKFMKSNLLHINLGKCCFMHFNPKTKCSTTNEEN